ncbi:MAG: OmpA family protein [Bacteroidetes bacterium]|nr:OmpA family protein [Bacteroidota bacterium]
MKSTFLIISILFSTLSVQSQGKKYPDGHGGTIFLPQGDISFADEVVDFKRGEPDAVSEACDSTLSLNVADFAGVASNFTSLGCGGSLTLRFTDNALINIPGPDLYVFEVGKYIETTKLSVSNDGKIWIDVGAISGGVSSVDIGDSVKQGEVFHYVKLEDLKSDCKGSWPGADIDAVAAIGSGIQINLNAAVLFDIDKYELLPASLAELDAVKEHIKKYAPSKIIIEGHTDNTGEASYNQTLSERRAASVKNYLTSKSSPYKGKIKSFGYGSSLPAASNSTSQGQEKNRRVSIILIP